MYQGLHVRKPGKNHDFSEFDYWVFAAMEDLIGNLNRYGQDVSTSTFANFINSAIGHFSNGNQSAFCKSIGLNSWAVKGWLRNNEKPSLPQFLTICYGIDASPSDLVTKPGIEAFTHQILRCIPEKIMVRAERPMLSDRVITELSKLITAVANDETDHRPLAMIAKQLGHRVTCLKYWFPTQSALISKRFAIHKKGIGIQNTQAAINAVSNIVEQLQSRGEYVSNRKVNNHLLKQGMSLAKPVLFKAFKLKLSNVNSE
jgi:hypothetical protein